MIGRWRGLADLDRSVRALQLTQARGSVLLRRDSNWPDPTPFPLLRIWRWWA